jgi:hypothetical protein
MDAPARASLSVPESSWPDSAVPFPFLKFNSGRGVSMKSILLAVVLTFAMALCGQTTDNSPHSSTVAVMAPNRELPSAPSGSSAEADRRWTQPTKFAVAATPSRPSSKTWDTTFVLLSGVATALTVADMELTARCTARQTCSEVNPLYGANPTRARLYGISLPMLGGELFLARWLKHRHPDRKVWMMPLIANSATHAVGTATAVGK